MKKLLLTSLVVLCAAALSHADVYIYKNKLKMSSTGGGETTKATVGGWTVISDSGQVVQVLAYPKSKGYTIAPMQSIEFNVADGFGGRQYTFFLQHDIWTGGDGSNHVDTGGAKGANSSMTVNGQTVSIPKTYSWSGRSTYHNAGTWAFEETSGTFTFDKNQTAESNNAGEDVNAAADRLAGVLESQGYSAL